MKTNIIQSPRPWALALLLAVLPLLQLHGQDISSDLKIELTIEEQKWLDEHDTLRVAGPKAFPPFHYYDEKGTAQGIAPEYIDIIASTLGLNVEYSPALPWPEVLSKMETRQIDIIACAAESAERKQYMDFSLPYLSFPMVIISRRDAPFVAGLNDLHGDEIAIVRNVMTYDWLQRDLDTFRPFFADTPLDALKAVSTGAADVCLENLAAATYLLEKEGLANLKIAAPTDYGNYNLHISVRGDAPILTSIIDKALRAIPQSVQTSIRNRWIMVRYDHGIRSTDILRWVSIVAAVSLGIILLVLLWNWKLRRLISEIRTLSGLVPICSSCKNIRDDEGYWTQIEDYIRERSDARFSHGICPECTKKLYPELEVL